MHEKKLNLNHVNFSKMHGKKIQPEPYFFQKYKGKVKRTHFSKMYEKI